MSEPQLRDRQPQRPRPRRRTAAPASAWPPVFTRSLASCPDRQVATNWARSASMSASPHGAAEAETLRAVQRALIQALHQE